MNNNLVIIVSLNPDKSVKALLNLSHLPSEEDFEAGLFKMTLKTEYREANIYSFERGKIKFPDYMFRGIESDAIIQLYYGKPVAAFMPWFVRMQDPI